MTRHRRIGWRSSLAVVLGLSGTLAAALAVADEPGSPGKQETPQVRWSTCPKDVVAEAAPTKLRCATVPVPVNYAKPEGARIDLMISRLASENPDKRRGTLMLNPGGPGGSGLTQPALLVDQGMSKDVLDSYDLIGMDTRGIGRSAPIKCGFTADGPYLSNIPPYAVDGAAVTEQAKIAKQAAEKCESNDDDGLLRHLTTANTARDLDRIRAALGEEKTSYLGYSYGTALGAAYASMFPERSDRIVLDGNIGDTHLDHNGMRRYALGMEDAFPDFAKWAAARDDDYGLGSTPEQVRKTYFSLAERLRKAPVAGVDGAAFRQFTFSYLFQAIQYPKLAKQWQTLAKGAEAPADGQSSQDAAAGTESPSVDNPLSIFAAVTCNDVEWPENVDTYRQSVAKDRERYPLFGAAAANVTPCAFWPYAPEEPPVEVNDDGPRNVLIVQNLRDPATPHQGGKMMREKFADRSRLLSVDGGGHGAYVLGNNPCAQDTTGRFLVEGTMPEKDTLCPAD